MNCSFFPPVRAALLGAALVGLTATAPSAAQVQSGVLECNVAPGVGFIIGSSKTLSCVFHRARGRPEFYAGTINRIGVDVGLTGPGQFALDASMGRAFPFRDHGSIDLRFDATNALNHVTFPSWNTTVTSAQFGLANPANAMRSLRANLRVRF